MGNLFPKNSINCFAIFRHASLVPLAVFHSTTKDFEYKGYKIPKDTMLISSLYHVLHDPENFENPETFRPERYIWMKYFLDIIPFSDWQWQTLFQVLEFSWKVRKWWEIGSFWNRKKVLPWKEFGRKRILFILHWNHSTV